MSTEHHLENVEEGGNHGAQLACEQSLGSMPYRWPEILLVLTLLGTAAAATEFDGKLQYLLALLEQTPEEDNVRCLRWCELLARPRRQCFACGCVRRLLVLLSHTA